MSSLPSFYQIDYATGNGHLLASELRNIATGKATLTETCARIAMLNEFRELGAALGFSSSKSAYMMTNILSGVVWDFVNTHDDDELNDSDLELQRQLLDKFQQGVARFVLSHPNNAPDKAYEWYVANKKAEIARVQYDLSSLSLKRNPPQALPDLKSKLSQLKVKQPSSAEEASFQELEQYMVVCNNCGKKGFPSVRSYGVEGMGWRDGIVHLSKSNTSGISYHSIRDIQDEAEAIAVKKKYPNLRVIIPRYRELLGFQKEDKEKMETTSNDKLCPKCGSEEIRRTAGRKYRKRTNDFAQYCHCNKCGHHFSLIIAGEKPSDTLKEKQQPAAAEQQARCPKCELSGITVVQKAGGRFYEAFKHYNPEKQKDSWHYIKQIPEQEFIERKKSQVPLSKL